MKTALRLLTLALAFLQLYVIYGVQPQPCQKPSALVVGQYDSIILQMADSPEGGEWEGFYVYTEEFPQQKYFRILLAPGPKSPEMRSGVRQQSSRQVLSRAEVEIGGLWVKSSSRVIFRGAE